MSTLFVPIRAERYREQKRLSDLLAPPYDVLSEADRAAFAARDAANIVHVTLPDGGADRYRNAAAVLDQWRRRGVLMRDDDPSLYVIQQEFATPDGRTHVRTGVIGGLAAEGYEPGRVRPHERTHRGPKEDRLALARATETAVESIFVLARDERQHLQRRLDGVTHHAPMAVGEVEGIGFGLWRVGGVQAAEIAHAVGDGPLYIADGHHRFETASALRRDLPAAEWLPALVVPIRDPGLVVLPTHRIIRGDAVTGEAVRAACGASYAIEEREAELDPLAVLDALGPAPAAMVLLPDGGVLTLAARQSRDGELEIAAIEEEVVGALQRAAGPSAAVTYSASPGDVLDAVAHGAAAGVLVRPTPAERVLQAADAGEVMPPKSTFFFPKVPGGVLLLPFGEPAYAAPEIA